jgi:dipeptidyl aminopeptidase/acylaminoacyl peptidase
VYENAVYGANLWRIDPAGAVPPRALWVSTRYTSQPQLSPDGKRVAFVSNREGQDAIYLASLDAEAARLPLPPGYRYIRPRWSADGRSLYAIRSPVGALVSSQAVRLDLERGTSEVLEALGRAVADVRESADGQWLYFGETSGHAMRLMRAPLAHLARAERLPVPMAAEFQLNRTALVFSQPQLLGLTRCRLDGAACEQLDAAISDANRFEWALGEREVWYREMRSGATLARFDLEGRQALAPIVMPPGQVVVSIALDASGTQVLVAREERTAIDLMLARR